MPTLNSRLTNKEHFFTFLADSRSAAALDTLTAEAAKRPNLADWLFPNSRATDRSEGAWYVVLDPTFDPLPVWKRYRGRALFLFGEHDDSTPTSIATNRLKGSRPAARIVPGAQHLGLLANNVCNAELADVSTFSAAIMRSVADFGAGVPRK